MSKNWKQKGWNQMETLLDEAMPVQRRPLFPIIPVPMRIIALALIVTGSAYWTFNVINSGDSKLTLNAFDFSTTKDRSAEIIAGKAITNPQPAAPNETTTALVSASNKINIHTYTDLVSTETMVDIHQTSHLAKTEIEPVIPEAQLNIKSLIAQDHSGSILKENSLADNSNPSESSEIITTAEKNKSDVVQFLEDETESLTLIANQSEMLPAEPVAIVNPKLKTTFSIGASAGNYSFSGPTLYGQLQLNVHIPLTKSFNLTFLAGAGKGLLYQNTEVLLAEYSNNQTSGVILGVEAPESDLSAYMDIKSVSNVVGGAQIQWQLANKLTFAVGAQAAYLFNIKHQAIQSTSLLPEGQSPQQIFTASEIAEKFAHWNHWDLRMNASIQYHMTRNWSMLMSYNRGLTNLLKHPISTDHNVRMNSLSLGLNYRF